MKRLISILAALACCSLVGCACKTCDTACCGDGSGACCAPEGHDHDHADEAAQGEAVRRDTLVASN